MAINVADNFSYKGGKPLDARVKYSTIAAMVAVPAADLYDGCMAYVTATKLNYQYDSSNTADPTLGKWREFQAGGGGGHEILDAEDTALTQRDKLKFGNGLTASDNSTDEQTEVEVDVMSSEDMDDVVTPLPSVGARYHKYSTEEQVVGEWINGKLVYEKTLYIDSLSKWTEQSSWLYAYDLSDLNVEMLVAGDFVYMSNGGPILLPNVPLVKGDTLSGAYAGIGFASKDGLMLSVGSVLKSRYTGYYATIRYTKTTD